MVAMRLIGSRYDFSILTYQKEPNKFVLLFSRLLFSLFKSIASFFPLF
jgi:hypothetical protein